MAGVSNSGEDATTFDMGSLQTHLPHKRGLSKFYSGKSKSFTFLGDVKCPEDLEKKRPENPGAKRKKYSDRQGLHLPPVSCRRAYSSAQFTPSLGM